MEKKTLKTSKVSKEDKQRLLDDITPVSTASGSSAIHAGKNIEPRKPGRPTVMTPEVIGKLEEVFAIDGTVKEACFYADIHPDTYYAWVKENPEYSVRFEALRERPVLLARKTVVSNLKTPQGAQWYLQNKARKEFGATREDAVAEVGKTNVYNFFFSTEVQEEVRSMEEKIKQALIQPRNVQ